MARQFRLWENAEVVSLLTPSADAAGRTSKYISLKNGVKAFIVCYLNQGNAATVALTPLQATDNLGTNSKAITATPIATNLDTDTVPADQFTMQPAAANFTTDAGLKSKIVIFEIQPEECMDVNNTALGLNQGAFNHIAIQTGASNAGNITSALLVVTPLRYAQQNPPTANI
jgi:hypothetical protein